MDDDKKKAVMEWPRSRDGKGKTQGGQAVAIVRLGGLERIISPESCQQPGGSLWRRAKCHETNRLR